MWLNHQYEYAHEHTRRHEVGTIEINDEYVTRRKPIWLVLLKVLGLAVMVAAAVGIGYPSLRQVLPALQAAAVISGVILIYSGLAFFFRPEANTDNLGYCGGSYDDPTKISDDINRTLLNLHFLLGPGRYASETLLDVCVLFGIARGDEVLEDHTTETAALELQPAECPPAPETGGLRANRFDE